MSQISQLTVKKLKGINHQFNDHIELAERRKEALEIKNKLLENRKQELERLISQQGYIISYQQKEISKLDDMTQYKNTKTTINNDISIKEHDLMTQNISLENKYIDAVLKANDIITKYNCLVKYVEEALGNDLEKKNNDYIYYN